MYLSATDPRSTIIWTRSRELSLNVRYHLMHRTMISWSKCRPLKRSCAEVGFVIPAVIARHRSFQHSWRLDETYIRVKGKWVYLYRAVDSTGATQIKSSKRTRYVAISISSFVGMSS